MCHFPIISSPFKSSLSNENINYTTLKMFSSIL